MYIIQIFKLYYQQNYLKSSTHACIHAHILECAIPNTHTTVSPGIQQKANGSVQYFHL